VSGAKYPVAPGSSIRAGQPVAIARDPITGAAVAIPATGAATAPPDPRAAREQRRREIDAVLREDARRFPAFATARRCAVMASVEAGVVLRLSDADNSAGWEEFLADLRAYETVRGTARIAATFPGDWCDEEGVPSDAILAYERARSLP